MREKIYAVLRNWSETTMLLKFDYVKMNYRKVIECFYPNLNSWCGRGIFLLCYGGANEALLNMSEAIMINVVASIPLYLKTIESHLAFFGLYYWWLGGSFNNIDKIILDRVNDKNWLSQFV